MIIGINPNIEVNAHKVNPPANTVNNDILTKKYFILSSLVKILLKDKFDRKTDNIVSNENTTTNESK